MSSQMMSLKGKGMVIAILLSLGLFNQAQAALTYTLNLDGVDSTIAAQITSAMQEAASYYNTYGTFNKHVWANYNSGVPTAQANYDGWIEFGGSRNTRVAMHEIAHTMGVGTYSAYWNLMYSGSWHGSYATAKLRTFDGSSATLYGDSQHFWPYGLNYDSEDSTTNRQRHVQIVQCMQCDMGLNSNCSSSSSSSSSSGFTGTNKRIINRASSKVMDAVGNTNGSNVIIYTDYSNTNQRWNIALISGSDYSIRSAQSGNRSADVWNWGTSNGTNIALYSYWGGTPQRFRFSSVATGYYRITPAISTGQCLDAYGTSSGSNVGTWSYWGGSNQQWSVQ
ncbi:RICIN domain-containing protein [Candidatus Sumerlaeota bacterium]|nr:RICIN domain-containing protein [Candidatus Sumerlaeota bacterium]